MYIELMMLCLFILFILTSWKLYREALGDVVDELE